MNAPKDFMFSLACFSLDGRTGYPDSVKAGGKIILPPTLLKYYSNKAVKYPLMFQIIKNGEKVHCGVLDFTAKMGEMYLPHWMMCQLKMKNGEKTFIKYCEISKGASIVFQPHNSKFLDIVNHKSVLEGCLVNFACLTVGDTIPILYGTDIFYGDVLECKPSQVISIIDCDLVVDFKEPKDYEEKTKARQN